MRTILKRTTNAKSIEVFLLKLDVFIRQASCYASLLVFIYIF